MNSQKDFNKLLGIGREIHTLRGVNALLGWDQETYMPHEGAKPRSEQIELLASLTHKAEVSKKFLNALEKLIDIESGKIIASGLNSEQKAALKEWRKHFLNLKKLPNSFVRSFAKLSSEAIHAWSEAKKLNNFDGFAPYLKKIVEMCKRKSDYLGYAHHPYDALIDQHEPGMTKKTLDSLFLELKRPLKSLLEHIITSKKHDTSFLKGSFSNQSQLEAATFFLNEMGYDFKKGRLDLSNHPFSTTLHPNDSRVTTRLDPHNFMNNIGSVLHEGGHGLYEMGLPEEYFGSPLCEAASLGVHESQSRFWETRIGQSKAFWSAYLPQIKILFNLPDISLEKFYKAINTVEPTLIRVDADEVTYSFHVILRYELEVALLDGSLKVEELSEAWNEKMKQYLGITPQNYSQGVLQDIHWSMGELGYFPTYTLGNLYAAHFFEGFEKSHPDWQNRIANKELAFVKNWLKENIHKWGKQFSAVELIENAAGKKPFSSQAYIHYLQKKYKELY